MQFNEPAIEKRFGDEVLEGRRLQRVSQKQLAEILRQRGLPLDASAISRIEKGTRVIRLSEASVIADVLGFSLADVEHARNPRDDFERTEKALDGSLDALLKDAYEAAMHVNALAYLAQRNQTVLTFDVEKVRQSWETNFIARSIGTRFETAELRDATRALLTAVAAMGVDDYIGVDDPR